MLVNGKFEETSRNQLSVVLSAFDDLCIPLARSNIAERSQQIWQQLLFEFGPNFHLLVRTLPNVLRLSPSSWTAFSFDYDVNSGGEVNFFSLCDIIKRFMRVVSSSSCPVMLFLDDMQWADQVSLGLVYSVLSDASRASCMLFVGSYRDNDVSQNHIIYDFYDWLSAFHVPLSTIHLNGVTEDDTNSIVADALGMLPRMCRSISQVVFRKTKGNPFFVQTFLRSLVDKRLLTYSLREKSWTWDTDEIYAENITPNVLDLISAKMAHLPQSGQTALKVASCFGIKIHVSIVQDLSETPQYFNLLSDLNKAVKDDFMDLDADGSHYRFVHDQVREAAYDMISSDSKDQYHFDIGIALLHTCETRIDEKRNVLSAILDQINHGVPSLLFDQSQRISVAKINFHAGAEAMQCYNYVAAYIHAKSAILLLPDDSWTTHYDLCLKLHLLLSKAAFSFSKLDEAKEALNKVVKHSGSVETTLDAYDILHSILLDRFDQDEMGQLLVTVIGVLKTLGENIPHEDVATEDIDNQVSVTAKSFEEATDEVLLHMDEINSKNDVAIVQGYSIVVILAHIARPNLFPYFAARWAQFCLQHRVACKHVAVAYVTFAVVLCKNLSHEDVQVGQRIGKLGLKMLNGSDSSMCVLPLVHLFYYGYLGILSEPVQVCIEMHRKAHDIGLQVGNISIATLHKLFLIYEQLHSGRKLLGLKEELEHEMKRTEHYCLFPVVGTKLQTYYETVLALIGEKSSDLSHQYQNSDVRWQAYTYGQIISSTFLGHFERVKHLVKMMDESNCSRQGIILFHVHVCFYDGLASIILQRRRKWKNLPKNVEKLIEVVQNASVCSKWNFKNKASLLLAEKLSLCSQNRQAEVEYDLAITAAQSSKFIHEEGLACELAGAHHVRVGNIKKAVALFRQAEHCYKDWGSLQKSRQMIEKVKHIAVKQSQIF